MSLTAINKVKALKKERSRRRQKSHKRIDLSIYKEKPIEFLHEILNIKVLTVEQKKIAYSILNKQTTNVQASHSIGKSFLMAGILTWWAFAVEGVAVSTAPTHNQVNDILWKEVRKLYDLNKSKLGGSRTELTLKKINSEGITNVSFGKASRNYDSNSFQGLHSKRLMLIQDEADGITDTIDEAFEACLTGSENRGIRIGNPLTPNSSFAKNCAIASIKIPVWNHPNVAWAYREELADNNRTIHRLKPEISDRILKPVYERKDDPVKPQDEWDKDLPRDVIPGAVSIAWIEKVRIKYGEFSAYWQTRVEAEFPTDTVDGIIPLTWLKEARDRYDRDPDYWDELVSRSRWRIGVDVGDGGDNHAVSLWKGCVLYKVKTYATSGDREDVVRLAKEIIEPMVDELGANYVIAVDRIGVGAGTLAVLRRDRYIATECVYGAPAENKEQFKNRKVELHWEFREGLRNGEIAIAPLGNIETEVFEDLSAIRYDSNTDKQIYCEPKEKTKKRLKRSPDAGDSVIIACENSYEIIAEPQPTVITEDMQLRAMIEAKSDRRSYDNVTVEDANKYG